MAPRPYWSGHVRLSLVAFPVRLYPAIESKSQVTLHQYHKPTGERIRYQKIVPELGPVDSDEIVKGYEYEKGSFVELEEGELDQLKLESTKTIDLVQFVESDEIDEVYYERPYFMVPDGKIGEEAFRVVRDALKNARKVALGQIVLASKERIAAIRPCSKGMVLETLRYAEEVRQAQAYFESVTDAKPPKEQVELARQLIDSKTAPFDADRFHDRYQSALRELIEGKLKGELAKTKRGKEKGGAQIIDLTEALKRSLGGKGQAADKAGDDDEAPQKASKSRSKASSGSKAKTPRRKTEREKAA